MGCVSSGPEAPVAGDPASLRKSDGTISVPEIGSSSETISAKFGGVSVRYGFLSQRGFYPDEAGKPNQDSYSITRCVGGEKEDALFAVYDGHGRYGDACAQYARDNLPALISDYSMKMKKKKHKRSLTKDQISNACAIAHRNCNVHMHREATLNDTLSGTTAISCLFHGNENRIVVSNVGDSRAVLGQRIKRKGGSETDNVTESYRALPLSSDQTPYRADERKRVLATGARILSLDQIEGLEPIRDDEDQFSNNDHFQLGEEIDETGDPPRVWSPRGDYPGTAFTRSFGDSIAEQLGVFAEPEVLLRELTPEDRIIVLGTDGVFEFLTNQSVIDICAKFDDPLEACRAVVAESYELWLQYELRTDDITMICIFVDSIDESHTSSLAPTPAPDCESAIEDPLPTSNNSSRPVRMGLSKLASKALLNMKDRLIDESDENPENFDIKEHYTEKTEDERARILKAIESETMLQALSSTEKDMVVGLMEPIHVKKGNWIIRQGTIGDRFFIVDKGCFEVRKVPQGEKDESGTGGNVVHTYHGSQDSSRFQTFGQFALINSAPRAASIIAQTDGKLWALHKLSFRAIYASRDNHKILTEALRKIPTFNKLDKDELDSIAIGMKEKTFDAEHTIVQDGDVGSSFYVIREGVCAVVNTEESLKICKEAGDYFGIINEKMKTYNATIVANIPTTCWVGKVDMVGIKE